jgi:hypothetical protein
VSAHDTPGDCGTPRTLAVIIEGMNDADAATIPTARKVLCGVYAAIAVIAAIATWTQVGPYADGLTGIFVAFWQDTKVTAAARFVACDVLLLALAVSVLFVVEARKHRIRFVWAYVIGAIFIGISVTAPLFLIARELKLGSAPVPSLTPVDVALLVVFGVAVVGFVYYIDFG